MIYLDHAATSWPKPPSVVRAVAECMEEAGGNPGRGAHPLAMRAAEALFACREAAASLLGAPGPEHVAFTMNATYALNMAIKGVARPGDHLLLDSMAHNATARPVFALAAAGVSYDLVDLHGGGAAALASLAAACRRNTRAVIVTHVPNISNRAAPLSEIGAFCRRRGLCLIVDAAQSAGAFPIDAAGWGIDVLCAPGHKGLCGPQGCGLLLFGRDEFALGPTILEGGSGVRSLERGMPDALPERYEAGTPPTPALAGLTEGIRFVRAHGEAAILAHERALRETAAAPLRRTPRVRLYDDGPGAVLLFNIDGMPSPAVGEALAQRGICVRAGFHCAPLAHRALGTGGSGAVRASFGLSNSPGDARALADAVSEIARA